ncbi:chromosomal replication initiator protein DnaA [Aureimonas altamirensis]|jgi:chromosomal replication initiator protein|uniref:Chromosomal replication initiator protein DnaA n=2 Tax=Aureimonas altamirensis TaxID=370622 RepID=A0ABY1IPC0_9HYPH|nr:chromosomal replication initiator protein DnaA [Aureimonas altamirensis]SHJ75880.1 chromosomal replication initiator protein DnaA [Aureimonas altamirensis DSM 21988]
MNVAGGNWSLDAAKRQQAHTAFDHHEGAQTPMRTLPARNDDEVMERVRARLKAQLGQDIYASWFQRMKIEAVGRGSVQLSVPTAFLKTWINGHYKDFLQQIFAEEVPGTMRVDIQVRSAVRAAPPAAASVTAMPAAMPVPMPANDGDRQMRSGLPAAAPALDRPAAEFGSPLDPRYVFSGFVEGPSNRVALAAARSIAENGPHSVRFNPLFIHASVGLGKTHLLQAIANSALTRADNPRVVYLTAEYFMWRFATAIRDNQALDFKQNLRGIDLLIIDDMQFLQGRSIQQEFCHLLNALIDSARQVIVAADRPAYELEALDQRVRSRLAGGVSIEMASPDLDMRRTILNTRISAMKADDPSFELPETVVDTIAKRITGSGRDLEGAFNQIAFRHSVGQPLSSDHLNDLLNQLTRNTAEKRVRIEDILKFVSRHYNVSRADILSARRTRTIVRPRQIAMYLAKTMTPRSLPEIGRRFGNRDHTTVLHAVRKIEAERAGDSKLSEELDIIRRMIEE